MPDPITRADREYAQGLPLAVSVALEHGFCALEQGAGETPPVPTALLAQARRAARAGVSLDTVMRRYVAGFTALGDFVVTEAESESARRRIDLRALLGSQSASFDRVIAAVSEEYSREKHRHPTSGGERRAQKIVRLLAGEPIALDELRYDFEGWHLGVVSKGLAATAAVVEATRTLDRRLMEVQRQDDTAWVWMSARRAFPQEELNDLMLRRWPQGGVVAVGEPGRGVTGWRRTLRQAQAVFPIALRRGDSCVRYRGLALVASVLTDDLLTSSLRALYLTPLEEERDGGEKARDTLRAYFAAGRQVSSAAAALGVDRHTVTKRLRAIQARLGCQLDECGAEVETALRIADLTL